MTVELAVPDLRGLRDLAKNFARDGMKPTKPTLVQVSDWDYGAFKRELLATIPRLRRFCYALTGSMTDADDLLQMSLERALEKWQGFEPGTEMLRWLFRVSRNIWIDEVRSSKRKGVSESFDELEEFETPSTGDDIIVNSLAMDQVASAMEALPATHRSVLNLVAVDGCSYKEAAEILDLPIGTVMSRLARARKHLADLLKFDENDS